MEQLISENRRKVYLKKAVCIVSGGLDSICTAAYVTRIKNFDIYMINFSYGQRATNESSVAKNFAIKLGAKDYRFVDISFMKDFYRKTNALTDEASQLPSSFRHDIVVPIRNAIFITIATAWALSIGARMVCYGAHAGDHRYPDCRPSFVRSISKSLTLADLDSIKDKSRQKVRIWCPAVSGIDKSGLLKMGYRILGDTLFRTWSCYSNGVKRRKESRYRHCGVCESCVNRKKAFKGAGIEDLTLYDK
jgi:7-cyano-7-deazaguanine synthase